MNQQVRFLLFVAISVVILITWSTFFAPKPRPKGPSEGPVATAPAGPAAVPGAVAPVPGTPPTPGSAPADGAEPPVERTTVETGLWTAVFSSKGAGLEQFTLKGRKQQRHTGEKIEGFNLVHANPTQPLPLSTEVGAAGAVLDPKAGYRVASKSDDALVYERTRGGYTVTKKFTWDTESYGLKLAVTVARADGVAEQLPVKVVYPAWEAAPKTGGWLSGMFSRSEIHQAVCLLAGERSMTKRGYKNNDPELAPPEPAMFAGVDEKFFLAAIAPAAAAPNAPAARCGLSGGEPTEIQGALMLPVAVPVGAPGTAAFDLYLGPKSTELLQKWGHGADVSIYDGSIAKAGKLLLPVLKFFHELVSNWGVAIILLTLLVKLVTFPLAHRQMKSMEQMKQLGPKLEEIKKKHDGDPQKQNTETMRLYKEHNVSPIGCAVPMLVQMPIWWALYATLQNSYELYNEPFLTGWIGDLTSHDPFYILPVLMTVTMVLTQVLTPQTSPQAQNMKAMTYGMPVFFGFMMMALPAGLVLYIFTNNLLSIGQSLWFRKAVAKTPVPA